MKLYLIVSIFTIKLFSQDAKIDKIYNDLIYSFSKQLNVKEAVKSLESIAEKNFNFTTNKKEYYFYKFLALYTQYYLHYKRNSYQKIINLYELYDLDKKRYLLKNNFDFSEIYHNYCLALIFLERKKFYEQQEFLFKHLNKYRVHEIYVRNLLNNLTYFSKVKLFEELSKNIANYYTFLIAHKESILESKAMDTKAYSYMVSKAIDFVGNSSENFGDYLTAKFCWLYSLKGLKKIHKGLTGQSDLILSSILKYSSVELKIRNAKELIPLLESTEKNLYDFKSFDNKLKFYQYLAKAYLQSEKFKLAKLYLIKVDSISSGYYKNKSHVYLAKNDFIWGEYYKKSGDLNKSLEYFHDAYKQYSKVYDKHEFTSMSLYQIGEVHRLKGNNSLAFSFYQKSMANHDKSTKKNEWSYQFKHHYDLSPLKRYNSNRHVLDVLTSKARLYHKICTDNGSELNHAQRKQLISFYHDIRRILNETEVLYLEEDGKLDLLNDYAFIYDDLIELEYQNYKERNSEESLSAIFDLMQESKSRLLKYDFYKKLLSEKTERKELKSLATLEDSLASFKTNLYKYNFAKKKDDQEHYKLLDDYLSNLFEYLAEKRKIQKEFEEEFKELESKKTDIKSFQKNLTDNELAISYYYGKNTLYSLGISNKKSQVLKEELKDLANDTKHFLTGIKLLDQKKTEDYAEKLYEKLLEGHLKAFPEKRELQINPDAELALIPFDALRRNDRYLTEDYIINYELSFDLNESILEENKSKKLLSFAPVFNKESENKEVFRNLDDDFFEELIKEENLANSMDLLNNVTELKDSKTEVKNISETFRNNNWKTENYLEKEASESKVKSLDLSDYKIIHFSTHSYQNRRDPNLSAVLFSNESKEEDGLLFASEIKALNLNADLVTLSSCESASGNVAKGEGALSLSRSFLMSGAKQTLVSLWKVDDRSTRKLMERFYQEYLKSNNFKSSLHKAKISLLKQKEFQFPRYWAAFTLNAL